ncbi:MAG: hypothetical protein CL608_02715 [Anaerolineaceae bacterium]|nr:hypothetical protein [Anaerolineaceae bacterium]
MSYGTYVSRKFRLIKDFDRSVSRVKQLLIARYGEEEANILMQESREKYKDLIPQIPYIGDRNPLLIFLLPASRYLAIYQTFQKHGRTVEEAGRLVYEIGEAEFEAIPGWVRRGIGVLWFSRWFAKRLQKRALLSQERKYSGGYVLAYIEGDGRDFDYGVDYIECAICKFLNEQGAAELAPYVCAVDKVASEMLGWGLRRTMTLAEGGERCDFRFKKGGKTCVTIPQPLR